MKLSDFTPEQWYARLNVKRLLQRRAALAWWQYMDLEQPLVYVARILAEQNSRFPALLLAWPELVLTAVEERLKWESFLLADETPVDELNRVWQVNDMDEQDGEAHLAAMCSGQHFLMVGPGDGDDPMITTEYEDQVAVEIDPRTRQPKASLKVWQEDYALGGQTYGALCLWDGRTFGFVDGKVESEGQLGSWARVLQDDPTMPSVPVVPILNKPRRGVGQSDLVALKPIVDGGNQFATNLMAAGEHHAVPRKWGVNVSQKDFVDENGNQIPLWKIAQGDVWTVPPPDQQALRGAQQLPEVKLGQFSASDLRNFHETIKMLATVAGSVYGLPPSYMGYSNDNPPSAESILYSIERLVLRTEKRQGWFGGSRKKAARIAWSILGNDPQALVGLEVKWRDAATPTIASRMDAVSKGLGSGAFDVEHAWVMLQFSEQTKKGLRDRMGQRAVTAAQSLRDFDANNVPVEVPGAPVLRS